MPDILSPEARSERMSRIRSSDTKPELLLRKAMHARGFRYVLGGSGLPGRPDIVLPKYRTVIFVHGCFWHLHSCLNGRRPGTNPRYWSPKLEANVRRDRRSARRLRAAGWKVITVWECKIKREADRAQEIDRIVRLLRPN
ncbi:DNA mismatch endonuclease Vsr [uncultured Stenotrophomonas sp.]|uniref:very short patch repair endonuclease n=1 Tax=uncultured Stenotrophomonas sp. TaxID=165438 RepID=UPI0025D721B1|nr:DNA mismatch endonuclease Vsr [uncultured Stenotrophomonas sp.]